MRVVLDTSVLVAGWRSRRGASFALFEQLTTGKFEIALSVPLVLEYEDVLKRNITNVLTEADVVAFIDYFCSVGVRSEIFFLWRPMLRDPNDDMVLEVAVASQCFAIVTHNIRDFDQASLFGIQVLTPGQFLLLLGEKNK